LDKTHDTFEDDFGFSTVDTEEISGYNQQIESLTSQVFEMADRLERMHSAINKLLTNLSKNPEQELIKWPNRAQKIEEFKLKLDRIRTGEE
jgi:septal ring factor EnvC (AmiA/AmiB activator)